MSPTFSLCRGSTRIADAGSTISAIVDEVAGEVLASQTCSVYVCAECGGTFAAVVQPAVILADDDFVYARVA